LLGLSLEQRAVLRSWMQQQQPVSHQAVSGSGSGEKVPATKPKGFSWKVKLQGDWTPGLVVRIALLSIVVASLGWWRWQRGWHEIEAQLPAGQAAITRSLVTVPANVMEQRLMHRVDPVYSDEARQGSLPSMVVLHAIIDAEGRVVRLEPVSGPQALAQAAMEAARWWRYEPYMVNGKAAEVETTLEVQFRPPLVSKN
jgi:TonB family protein